MPEQYIETHIRNVPLFRNLPQEQFLRLASAFERRQYRANEVVYQQGSPTQGLYVLVEGMGVLQHTSVNGEVRDVGYPRMDEVLNQEALITDGIEDTSFIAMTPMTILFLSRDNLRTLMAHYPEIKASLGLGRTTQHHVEDVHFRGQRENERIVKLTRQHWWAYARRVWMPITLMLALWVFAYVIPVDIIRLALFGLSIIVPGLMILYLYLEWQNDSIIVTDERVIRITHTLPFREIVNEMPIHSIHEVNFDIPSGDFFARLFDYGTIQVKTAGDAGDFMLGFIPQPQKLQMIILEDRQEYTKRQAIKHRNTQRADLEKWLQPLSPQPEAADKKKEKPPTESPRLPWFKLSFELPSGETVYRHHFMVWIKHIILPTLLMLAAFILMGLDLFNPFLQSLGVLPWAISAVVFISGFLWFYWTYWDWANDYYMVSDSIITIVHQRPLWLQNKREQLLLSRIDNVEAEIEGFFEQMFQYGDLKVSLTGADQPQVFYSIPRPRRVQEDISRRRARLRERESKDREQEDIQRIGEFISLYHERIQQQGMVTPSGEPTQSDPAYPPSQPNYPTMPNQPAAGWEQAQPTHPVNPPVSPPRGFDQPPVSPPPVYEPPPVSPPTYNQPPVSPPTYDPPPPAPQGYETLPADYEPPPPTLPDYNQPPPMPPEMPGNVPPRPPGLPSKPTLSEGRPYTPPKPRSGSRPPGIPRKRLDNE